MKKVTVFFLISEVEFFFQETRRKSENIDDILPLVQDGKLLIGTERKLTWFKLLHLAPWMSKLVVDMG